jgi:hypothetical protein
MKRNSFLYISIIFIIKLTLVYWISFDRKNQLNFTIDSKVCQIVTAFYALINFVRFVDNNP